MNFHLKDIFLFALSNLWENRIQGILATLGVIVGCATLISTLSVGEGVKRQVLRDIEELGTNLIFVRGQTVMDSSQYNKMVKIKGLTTEDVDLLKNECSEIEELAPQLQDHVIVRSNNKSAITNLEGSTPVSASIRNWHIKHGRYLWNSDVENNRKICILGYNLSKDLFDNVNPVGNSVILDNTPYSIVGVLERKGNVFNVDYDNSIIIPISTAQQRYGTRNGLDSIIIKSTSADQVPLLLEKVDKLLLKSHGIDNFSIWSQEEHLKQRQKILISFQILMGSLAVISLIVGGIGIMNIMLASVYNRIREIGIRKAIGAKSRDIIAQFLTEAILISAMGGILGIGMGMILGPGISSLIASQVSFDEPWTVVISFRTIIISFVFAFVIGIIFGLYPAIRASKLNPVDALRYE